MINIISKPLEFDYELKKKIEFKTRIPKIEEQIKDLDNNMPKSFTRENVK